MLRIERESLASVLVARESTELRRLTLGVLTALIKLLRREDRS